jgi:transglutaminase-like putative cysteine protease
MKVINARIGDLFTHLILWMSIFSISWRLESTNWVPGLERIGLLILLGYLFGVVLGVSKFKTFAAIILSFGYTIMGVTWQALSLVEGKTYDLHDTLLILGDRLSISLYQFINNLPVEDPVLFYISLGILLWLTSVSASFFFIRKKSPWAALVLSAVFLLLIDYFPPYADHPGRELGVFLLLAMIIVGRVWYLRSQERWNEKGYRIDSETGYHILRSISIGSLAVLLVAWNIPTVVDLFTPGSTPRTKVSESWIDFRTRISNMFASIEAPFLSATDYYEDSMRLGSNVPVGYETLFMVKVPDRDGKDIRYYWRGHSFDSYRNGEWLNTINQRDQRFGSLVGDQGNPYTGRTPVTLDYELRAGVSKTLYLPFLPVKVDRNVFVIGYETYDETSIDIMSVLPITPLKSGDRYTAEVYVSQPTVRQLRNAGTKYPDWILEKYLQLPENFPTRIQELTSEIVAEAKTPYDQTAAITRYLRTEIAYEPLLTAPPPNREPIDWMLFDSKIGFCNYYATAEVLMLRSIGVPARFSAGYSQGEPAGDAYYNVRVRDSHAWPEVFFPGVGWVEFEPTSAQPVRDLPLGETLFTPRTLTDAGGSALLSNSEPPKDIDAFLDREEAEEGAETKQSWIIAWLWIIIPAFLFVGIWLINRLILLPRRKSIPGVLKYGAEKIGLEVPAWLSTWAAYAALAPIQKVEAQFSALSILIGEKSTPDETVNEKYAPIMKLIPSLSNAMSQFMVLFNESQYREVDVEGKQLDHLAAIIRREYLHYWLTYKVKL